MRILLFAFLASIAYVAYAKAREYVTYEPPEHIVIEDDDLR